METKEIKITPVEQLVLNNLPHGIENAKCRKEVARNSGVSERKLRSILNHFRKIGIPVLHSCNGACRGLFIATCEEERGYVKVLEHNALDVLAQVTSVERCNLNDWQERVVVE